MCVRFVELTPTNGPVNFNSDKSFAIEMRYEPYDEIRIDRKVKLAS